MSASATEKERWPVVAFGDVVKPVSQRVDPAEAGTDCYVGLEHLDGGTLTIHRHGHPDDVSGQKLRFYEGDVIFGKRRAYQRKLAVARREGICSAHAMVLRANPEVMLPEFLPFFMQSDAFMERAVAISVGSLSPTINWKTLKSQKFPLPPPDEQRRIARLLWAADEAVEAWRDVHLGIMDAAETWTSNQMEAFFRCGGDAKGAARVKLLGDVADVRYGLTINRKREKLPLRRPYLRVANVGRGSLNLTELKDVGCDQSDLESYTLQMGDLLVVEGHADIREIGRACRWNDEEPDCLHQNHLIRVRCREHLLPDFLLALINSSKGRSYFSRFAQCTSGLNTINSTTVKKLKTPVPPMKVQEEFVRNSRMLIERKEDVDRKLAEAARFAVRLREESLASTGATA